MNSNRRRKNAVTAIMILSLIAVLLLSIILAVTIGSYEISIYDVYRIIIHQISFGKISIGDPAILGSGTLHEIIWNIRLPRVVMGAIVGIMLAENGVVMQASVQNPLADPYILGISSGASLGATFSIMIGASSVFTGYLAGTGTAFWAFAGSITASFLVFFLANIGGRMTSAKLVLAGSVIGSLCGSFTNMMVYIGNDAEEMKTVTYWLLGSMVSARWNKLLLPAVCTLIGTLFFLTQLRNLNTMLLGEEAAITLGINLNFYRRFYMVITSLMTAVAVCTCGIVGFVGLMIPHIVRGFCGSDHKRLFPCAAMSGGIFLIWADVVARIIVNNTEVPIGVITSVIGAPVFVYMIVKKSYGFGGGT